MQQGVREVGHIQSGVGTAISVCFYGLSEETLARTPVAENGIT